MLAPKNAPKLLFASIVAVLAAAIAIAGCGGGSGGGGGEPAGLAPLKAPVYLEVNLKPDSDTSAATNEIAQTFLGIENVGEFIAEELEKAALGEGEKFNFEEEVEPWLGEKAGMYLAGYDGDDFHGFGFGLETTNSGEAEEFIEKRVEEGKEPAEPGEFEGDKYYVSPDDESVVGMIGDYLAVAETKGNFEEMVEAFEGEGLNESTKFKEAIENAPDGGLGSVYVDIGGLIEEAKGVIPPESEVFFDVIGIEPKKATAVLTAIPHSEQVELDFSSNLGKTVGTSGDATALLESLPASSTVGFASAEFGKSFAEGVESLSKEGIPGQIQPGELEAALGTMGVNLKSLGEAFGDIGGFVEGTDESSLGGAIVIEAKESAEATKLVGEIGLLLRGSGTEGVTALNGNLSGFSIRQPSLGSKPLIVGSAGEKIVIAYGPKAAAAALASQAQSLGSTPGFEAAKSALGSTPMTAYIDGGPMLELIQGMLSPEEAAKFAQAEPYVEKISYVGVGSEAEGKTTTAKLVVGLQK